MTNTNAPRLTLPRNYNAIINDIGWAVYHSPQPETQTRITPFCASAAEAIADYWEHYHESTEE